MARFFVPEDFTTPSDAATRYENGICPNCRQPTLQIVVQVPPTGGDPVEGKRCESCPENAPIPGMGFKTPNPEGHTLYP